MKKAPIENKIYAAIIGACEEKEANKSYRGNGHHLAQELTNLVSIGLLPKQQRIIYDALDTIGKTSKQLSMELGISSKNVSSQLKQMYESTLLINVKPSNNRIKIWAKFS